MGALIPRGARAGSVALLPSLLAVLLALPAPARAQAPAPGERGSAASEPAEGAPGEGEAESDATPAGPEAPTPPPGSAAAVAAEHLADGRRLYRELDFPGCVDAMQRALAVPGVGPAQRLEAYEYLGAANVVLDREAEAEAAFLAMFELDPYHRVREPSGSPKIERFVEALRARTVPDAALDGELRLEATLPRAARMERPIPVRVDVEGGEVASVRVHLRGDEETEWRSVALPGGPRTFEGELPGLDTTGRLEIYAQARDAARRVVARAGEPLVPLVVEIRERVEDPTPLRSEWWLWTAVGVVAAGVALGVGVAVAGRETAPAGTLQPGRVELP